MNPVDHPHGGGEGRSPIGMPSPMTPWGKPTLGLSHPAEEEVRRDDRPQAQEVVMGAH